jgi:hypothetical protein
MTFRRFVPVFAWLCAACAPHPQLTGLSASRLAAELANNRCAHAYGQHPFSPEDFEAVYSAGRWHWGGAEGNAVDGFKAEVSFDAYGAAKNVVVSGAEDK